MCSGNWACLLLLATNVANMALFLSSAGNHIIYKWQADLEKLEAFNLTSIILIITPLQDL